MSANTGGRGGGSTVAGGAGEPTGMPDGRQNLIAPPSGEKNLKSGRRSSGGLGRNAEPGAERRRQSPRETRARRPWLGGLGAAGTMRAPSRPAALHPSSP